MNHSWTTSLTVAVAVGLTVVSGLWQGRISQRWGAAAPVQEAATRLADLPTEFGDWKMEQSFDLDPDVGAVLQCVGYVHRRYVHQENGQTVQVAVLLGPAGPISVHTPEICYSGAGYSPLGETKTVTVTGRDDSKHEINQVALSRDDDARSMLSVGYGWTVGHTFAAPKNPRWTFRNAPYLYKLQLATHVARHAGASQQEIQQADAAVLQEFLGQFLPALRPYLVSPPS